MLIINGLRSLSQRYYRKEVKKYKLRFYRNYCEEVESLKDTAQLVEMRESYLMDSMQEALGILLDSLFPGFSALDTEPVPNSSADPNIAETET